MTKWSKHKDLESSTFLLVRKLGNNNLQKKEEFTLLIINFY